MLKLSLGLRITNSRRNNLRSELRLGVRVARLLDAGPGSWLRRVHPRFGIVRDIAWISVDTPGAAEESGLETAIRQNPFGPADRVSCLAGLIAEQPGIGGSLLAGLVRRLAARTRRGSADVAAEWFERYVAAVAVPLLDLYATHGLATEAHLQNTLVSLDHAGWPSGGWYRDSQGYYLAASHAERADEALPGVAAGVPLVFEDDLVDQRVLYYLGVNNLLGLVGAFGSQGLADERVLLRRLRAALGRLAAGWASEGRPVHAVVAALLDAPRLPCKANYLTCVDGRDELAGPVATQSVYVSIPNPITEVSHQP